MTESNGILDGSFQVAYRKDPGPHDMEPYRNEYTGEVLNLTADDWYIPPNDNTIEYNWYNDFWLSFRYRSSTFRQRPVGTSNCHACVGEEVILPWVRVRGLCKKSKFDKQYKFADDSEQGVYLQGKYDTNITADNTESYKFNMIRASLGSNLTIDVYRAQIESPKGTFLLGKRTLKVEGYDRCGTNYTQDVVFTTCFDDEFTCYDGTCINMTKRCDNIVNCPYDMSDEAECKLLEIPSSYKQAYAPKGR